MGVDEELEPPDGYHFASTFKYPMRLILIARFLPIFFYPVLYLLAFLGIISGDVFRGLANLGVQVFIVVVWFSTDIVRGLIQRGICHLLGYDISFYPLFMAPLEPTFAADVGQYQRRRDALLIAMTPLEPLSFARHSFAVQVTSSNRQHPGLCFDNKHFRNNLGYLFHRVAYEKAEGDTSVYREYITA